jgi:chromate transporter
MPVIAVMLGQMAYEFAFKALKGLGKLLGVLFLALAFILLYVVPIHPAIVILIFLIYGAFHFRIKAKVRQTSE